MYIESAPSGQLAIQVHTSAYICTSVHLYTTMTLLALKKESSVNKARADRKRAQGVADRQWRAVTQTSESLNSKAITVFKLGITFCYWLDWKKM